MTNPKKSLRFAFETGWLRGYVNGIKRKIKNKKGEN